MNTDACAVCGCTELNLIDGFYYCVECNTQNKNVRETIVEKNILADGTFAISSKKTIVKVPKKTIQMSGEWYKWHAYNFILFGLADELVALGAKPTFKVKLLWIWTRYIKKYQNESELALTKEVLDTNTTNTSVDKEEINSDFEILETSQPKKPSKAKNKIKECCTRNITFLSKGVLMAMLYLALNLDKSDIQLSHLFRFVREQRLNFSKLIRFVPDDINVKTIPMWNFFCSCRLGAPYLVRGLSLTLLRKLDLGTPIIPDLKKIIDEFFIELCLPKDLKPLVYSLMHFKSCDFLDLDNNGKEYMYRVPDYECVTMAYILLALKMCFGLDDDYEVKLSDVVERINVVKDLPKSYRFGQFSDPTDRLFSFRDWCKYLQFRKIMLCKHCLFMTELNNLDIDDYVYMEHMADRFQNEKQLMDEITMDLLNKINVDNNLVVIPKEEFVATLQPMSLYTKVIADHCQDPEIKYLLNEDFTQYTLKYACKNCELIDLDTSENLVKGVSEAGKVINSKVILGNMARNKIDKKYVYVKNCENRNWMKTKPPTALHIGDICDYTDPDDVERNDKDSDHGYDSECTSIEKDSNHSKETKAQESHKQIETIREEEEGTNIFDDLFEYLDVEDKQPTGNEENVEVAVGTQNIPNIDDFDDSDSDISCTSLYNFNPSTFDREKTIRELVLLACEKYKIELPKEYKEIKIRTVKRKLKTDETEAGAAKKTYRANKDEVKKQVDELLSNYYGHVQGDYFSSLQKEVNVAIQNAHENLNLTENHADQCNVNVEETGDERNSTTNLNLEDDHVTHNNERTECLNNETNIDEINESELFEGEDTIFDDLQSKSDPKFDEKYYDIDQLYLKMNVKEPAECLIENPELKDIISRKLKQSKEDNLINEREIKEQTSDSEDEIPLSVIKEEKELILNKHKQEDSFKNLVTKEDLSEFKYWFRHYGTVIMDTMRNYDDRFNNELRDNTATSFYFVIKECASILNCTELHLYRQLQNLEEYLLFKSK